MTNEQLPALAAAVAAALTTLRGEPWIAMPADSTHGAPRSIDLAQRGNGTAPEFEIAMTLDWRNGARVSFDAFCRLVYQDERANVQRITPSNVRQERLATSCDVEREPSAIARQVNRKVIEPFLAEQLPKLREYAASMNARYEAHRAALIEVAELTGNESPAFDRHNAGHFYDRLTATHATVEVRGGKSLRFEYTAESTAEIAELLAVVRKHHPRS
jgi:hypothetical protein